MILFTISILGALMLLDSISTYVCVSKYGLSGEKNPVMRWFFETFELFGGTAMVILLKMGILMIIYLLGFWWVPVPFILLHIWLFAKYKNLDCLVR